MQYFFLFVSFSLCSSPSPPALSHAHNTSVTPLLRSNGAPLLRSNGIPLLRSNGFFLGFPPLDPLLSPTLGTLQSLHSLRTLQSLHCCEAMALNCCEAMVFGVFLSFTPCPLLRSEYLSSSIAAKQWYSIAAKQWLFVPPPFTLCLLPRSEYCTPLLRSNGIYWYSSPRRLEFPA